METTFKIPPLGIRIASVFVDLVSLTLVSRVIMFLTASLLSSSNSAETSNDDWYLDPYLMLLGSIVIILLSLFLIKDIVNGQSLGKRLLKLQIVNYSTRNVACPIECVLRNLTLLLWPLEALFILISPSRRLGDKLVGTQVVFEPIKTSTPFNWIKSLVAIALGLLITAMFAVIYLFLLFLVMT